ncbi:MAG: DUF3309 family protein [Nitrospira sp.]
MNRPHSPNLGIARGGGMGLILLVLVILVLTERL